MTSKVTIAIVDDEKNIIDSLSWLIHSVGYQAVAYTSVTQLLESHTFDEINCLILDVCMPGITGLELQTLLNNKNIWLPIIFITGHGNIPMAVRAMKAGATDFLVKPIDHELLLASIGKAITQYNNYHLEQARKKQALNRTKQLTKRELEIMSLLAIGKLSKTIAHELNISCHTVNLHRARIMKKMNVRTLGELVNLTLTHGLTQPNNNKHYNKHN